MQAIDQRVRENMKTGGVRPSSQPHEYFIYCVGQDPDRIAMFLNYCLIEDIGVKPIYGQYEGNPEESFVSNWRDFDRIKPWLQKEESVLFLDSATIHGHRKAKLLYMDGREQDIGIFFNVQKRIASAQSSFSYDPYMDQYYICM